MSRARALCSRRREQGLLLTNLAKVSVDGVALMVDDNPRPGW
jgi:hypothetical protein